VEDLCAAAQEALDECQAALAYSASEHGMGHDRDDDLRAQAWSGHGDYLRECGDPEERRIREARIMVALLDQQVQRRRAEGGRF